MRKRILVLLLLLCCAKSVIGQNTFEKVIDTLGCSYASCIKVTYDNGYVFCGKSNYGGNDVFICKLDSTGNIEWAKVYSGPSMEAATYIEQTPDSGYIVNAVYDGGNFYSKIWLLRLNAIGDTLWTKVYSAGNGGTSLTSNNNLASFNNNIYGLAGYFRPPANFYSSFIITTLSDGTILTTKLYSLSPFGSSLFSIDKTLVPGFVMAGSVGKTTSEVAILLIRTDPYGDTLWTKKYTFAQNDGAYDVKQTADSGFIVTGISYNGWNFDMVLLKTDSVGSIAWSKINNFNNNELGSSVEQTTDSGYIVCGSSQLLMGTDENLYVLKTNQFGDTLWTRTFGGSGTDNGLYIKQTKDGGYIIAGYNGSVGNGGAYIIKTDSLGLVSSTTGVAELNNPLQLVIYPNPSNGEFNVQLNGIANNAQLEIYTSSGERLVQRTVCNKTLETVNLKGHPEGMYLCALRTGTQVYYRKLILRQ